MNVLVLQLVLFFWCLLCSVHSRRRQRRHHQGTQTLGCFQRLGLDNQATKSEIKKAFHHLALETHPDKVKDASQKEAATVAFRHLYDAFEEAVKHCESGRFETRTTEAPSWNGKGSKEGESAPSYMDDLIRKVFQDISDELAREESEAVREKEDTLRLALRDAWSHGDGASACWDLVKDEYYSNHEGLKAIVQDFRASNVDSLVKLGGYLDNPLHLRRQRGHELVQRIDQERAEYVMTNWSDQSKVGDYMSRWSSTEFAVVADLVSDESIKERLLNLSKECSDALLRKLKMERILLARKIEDAYPNRSKMKDLLRSVSSWRRENIMELLPPEIRKAIIGIS